MDKVKKLKNLFLQQSYLDCWDDYIRSLNKQNFITWDYVILTASNEEQAAAYRAQITYRAIHNLIPKQTSYVVLPDPDGKRVGSGGATFNVLRYIAEQSQESNKNHFKNKRILVIHSGGDSKRVPQYSACGKLFSPVPRELSTGRASTLFDEFLIAMSGIPARIREGMMILSGDVLLLFNPLQIDFQYKGAAAISIKEPVETGKNHGVFLNDGNNCVEKFLHKQSEEELRKKGAVNERGYVDLDTGAAILDSDLLNTLFSLISTDNQIDERKFNEFVNEQARISFYGDFLYPLANKSTLEQYYEEKPEGSFCEALRQCREKLWEVLHNFQMKLLCLSPAEFIHFGTTSELLQLMTVGVEDYEFLGWSKNVVSNISAPSDYAVNNSLILNEGGIGKGSYIEDSYLSKDTLVGENSVISNVKLISRSIPADIVLHGITLKNGKHVVRIYGTSDNPKSSLAEDTAFLTANLGRFMIDNGLQTKDIWKDECYLWFADLYPVCDTMEEALDYAEIIYRMCNRMAGSEEIARWKNSERMSLYSSFNMADVSLILPWKTELKNQILAENFVERLMQGDYYKDCLKIYGDTGIDDEQYAVLMGIIENSNYSIKMRVYYALSEFMKERHVSFEGVNYETMSDKCFEIIRKTIYESVIGYIKNKKYSIRKDRVDVQLPVRVNWGGGWTDTPPHCNENGGIVLNAAIKLEGVLPIQVTVKRLKEYHVEFESIDIGVQGVITELNELQDCRNPYDPFALHKAALIACGIIPLEETRALAELLKELGGGLYLSTKVVNVPKGSGLGTSSILAGACVKGIFEFLGEDLKDSSLYDIVLCMEQIMSTGGGWQDQVGGLTPGIKLITTMPGVEQKIYIEALNISEEVKQELQERFTLIYTGQRRLARNLLRDVVGNYIGGNKKSVEALKEMQRVAILMKFELERGNINEFAKLLNIHWELSKQLDGGSTNTCIEQIFYSCEDLIDGRFIAGAGGGGFLQVILKKGISKEDLRERLRSIYQESGVDVWECEIIA